MVKDSILIADELEFVDLLEKSLKDTYKINPVYGLDCIPELLAIQKPQAFILNTIFFGYSTFQLCKTIKNDPKTKDIPIIFVDDNYSKENYIKAYEAGASEYFKKPFLTFELFEKLKLHIKLAKDLKNVNNLLEIAQKDIENKNIIINNLSKYDELTGLLNRAQLVSALEKNDKNTMIFIDFNNFSHINTTYGFEIGNMALKKIATFLKENVMEDAKIFRFTSDEFIILVQNVTQEYIKIFAQNLKNNIQDNEFIITEEISLHLSCSMAIASSENKFLLQHCQLAFQEAVKLGKNQIVVFNNTMYNDVMSKQNIYWMNKVRTSLENGKIVPYYQPIINNSTGMVEKFECLARIKDQTGVISPFHFLGPARSVGLISSITKTIITKSFQHFAKSKFSFNINITQEDLKEEYLLFHLQNLSNKYEIHPSRVTLEILEEISAFASKEMTDKISNIEEAGFLIALDDFGSEQANFTKILDLQPSTIKIDGQFIKNIVEDEKSQLITEAIVSIAKKLGCYTVAEYVHNKEVFEKVKEMGVDYSQGFFFSPPIENIYKLEIKNPLTH